MSDLQGRRGMVLGMNSERGFEHLKAKVPLKEVASYSTALSSLSEGRIFITGKIKWDGNNIAGYESFCIYV